MKASLCILALFAFSLRGSAAPLGAKPFVPSRQQPVGWRGNGTGFTQGIRALEVLSRALL